MVWWKVGHFLKCQIFCSSFLIKWKDGFEFLLWLPCLWFLSQSIRPRWFHEFSCGFRVVFCRFDCSYFSIWLINVLLTFTKCWNRHSVQMMRTGQSFILWFFLTNYNTSYLHNQWNQQTKPIHSSFKRYPLLFLPLIINKRVSKIKYKLWI